MAFEELYVTERMVYLYQLCLRASHDKENYVLQYKIKY